MSNFPVRILKIGRFKKARTIGPLHTGGPVALTRDGSRILTSIGDEVLLTDVTSGLEICRFAGVRKLIIF